MKNSTPLFPGFHLPTLRRKPRSERQRLADQLVEIRQKSFDQLSVCFGKLIPQHQLKPTNEGAMSRRRLFSRENTFWAFFSQILDADGGCKEVVRKLQAFAALRDIPQPSSSTSAYCQARKKLEHNHLASMLEHTSKTAQSLPQESRLKGRRVIVVDGTGVSMPDTAENQDVWPQPSNQKPGCGFPQARICGCFCLNTGMLLSYELGSKKSHELPLLRKQWGAFKRGDIFLGDKGFCSYFDISNMKDKGIDSVVTLARRKPVSAHESLKVLGKDDLLIRWKKPVRVKASSYSQADWEALPEQLQLRQIKVTVTQPGFRTSTLHIITTLLDPIEYPACEIADLYLQRWEIELFIRDIKTTIGMDILRCRTPDMVRKEILMHFIVYNCLRQLMLEASIRNSVSVRRISFKGTLQAIRQWEPQFTQSRIKQHERNRLVELLYDSIANNKVDNRPGRSEPRAVKRRPKPYQLLTAPRHLMKEIPHRGRYRAKEA